jgi:hypothetical protein
MHRHSNDQRDDGLVTSMENIINLVERLAEVSIIATTLFRTNVYTSFLVNHRSMTWKIKF